MKPIDRIESTAIPLRRSDVDTDQIIPSDWLKKVERTGFGAGLFGEWRDDPNFVLNDPRYAGARILVAGPNFGTGSSREHAVWSLTDYGFEAVISSRFGDIFRNNSTKAGLVPVVLDQDIVEKIWVGIEENPQLLIAVDLVNLEVDIVELGLKVPFPMDEFTQHRLIQGLDDIGLSLRYADDITRYEGSRRTWMPSTT